MKIQAVNETIRDRAHLELFAKVNTSSAKTVPQPLNSGIICALKRIEKTEAFLNSTQGINY